jgi:hypothetical protein
MRELLRLKFFFNVDTESRVWNIGPSLPELLRHWGKRLGPNLPVDLNMVCHRINESGLLSDVPMTRVEIPPGGIVFANGATVVHQVLYGRRMVALEGFVPRKGLGLDPDDLMRWIESGGCEARKVH